MTHTDGILVSSGGGPTRPVSECSDRELLGLIWLTVAEDIRPNEEDQPYLCSLLNELIWRDGGEEIHVSAFTDTLSTFTMKKDQVEGTFERVMIIEVDDEE